MKKYELNFPVFLKGDDLMESIKETKTLPEAFKTQAEFYEKAAQVCKMMAGIAFEEPTFRVIDAYKDLIVLAGPEERMSALVSDGVLYEFDEGAQFQTSDKFEEDDEEYDDDEEDDDWDDEEGWDYKD